MDLLDLAPVLSNVKNCINFLRGRNLLLQDMFCCRVMCSKVGDISLSDREIFQCNICHKRYSIRTNSFWAKSKLSLTILVSLLFFSANDLSVNQTYEMLKKRVSKRAIIQWYNYFRDVITTYFSNNQIRFNDGVEVHCDETFLGGKRKYGRGRIPKVNPRYLFGIVDKVNHTAFVQFIPNKNSLSIIPLITRHVPPGCEIHTDGSNVYKVLSKMRYTHKFCVHERRYVSQDGTHSDWIENFWSNLKIKLKSKCGSQGSMLDGHIDEYLYCYSRKKEGVNIRPKVRFYILYSCSMLINIMKNE